MGKGEGSGWGWGMGLGAYKGKNDRMYIPAMPMPIAIVCCVCNFLIPGLGSAISGISVYFCARTEDMDSATKMNSCLGSCGIGFLQLLAALFFFLGWFWSCAWGISFIINSIGLYHNNKVEDTDVNVAPVNQVQYTGGNATAVIMQPVAVNETHIVKM